MPETKELKTIAGLAKQVRDLEADVKDYREAAAERRKEAQDLEHTNLRLNHMRMAIYDSLIREKTDLEYRLMLIDVRLKAIELHPDQRAKVTADAR